MSCTVPATGFWDPSDLRRVQEKSDDLPRNHLSFDRRNRIRQSLSPLALVRRYRYWGDAAALGEAWETNRCL
jgi:hypothetical protein